jgi:hypothetical protein
MDNFKVLLFLEDWQFHVTVYCEGRHFKRPVFPWWLTISRYSFLANIYIFLFKLHFFSQRKKCIGTVFLKYWYQSTVSPQIFIILGYNFSTKINNVDNFKVQFSYKDWQFKGTVFREDWQFPLTPMGVVAPGPAHARPSAQPPIDMSGNFPAHVFAESPSKFSKKT